MSAQDSSTFTPSGGQLEDRAVYVEVLMELFLTCSFSFHHCLFRAIQGLIGKYEEMNMNVALFLCIASTDSAKMKSCSQLKAKD